MRWMTAEWFIDITDSTQSSTQGRQHDCRRIPSLICTPSIPTASSLLEVLVGVNVDAIEETGHSWHDKAITRSGWERLVFQAFSQQFNRKATIFLLHKVSNEGQVSSCIIILLCDSVLNKKWKQIAISNNPRNPSTSRFHAPVIFIIMWSFLSFYLWLESFISFHSHSTCSSF